MSVNQGVLDYFYNIYQILLFARFTRARDTGDKQDVAFTENQGMYMILAGKGTQNCFSIHLKKYIGGGGGRY